MCPVRAEHRANKVTSVIKQFQAIPMTIDRFFLKMKEIQDRASEPGIDKKILERSFVDTAKKLEYRLTMMKNIKDKGLSHHKMLRYPQQGGLIEKNYMPKKNRK